MLTDAHCRNANCPPDKKRYRLTDAAGLYLEVSPAGSKRWFWKTYADGKESRMALGSYPDVGLTAARKGRDAAKLQKSQGVDPVQARKIEKLKASRTDTVCYLLVLASALIRVFVPLLMPSQLVDAVLGSAALWSAAFALYAVTYWPVLTRIRADGKPG